MLRTDGFLFGGVVCVNMIGPAGRSSSVLDEASVQASSQPRRKVSRGVASGFGTPGAHAPVQPEQEGDRGRGLGTPLSIFLPQPGERGTITVH